MSEQQPLRVALILEGNCLPAWQHCLLERIAALPQIRIVMILSASSRVNPPNLTGIGLAWLRALDAFLFRVSGNAQQSLDAGHLLVDIPRLTWDAPGMDTSTEASVKALAPDVILDFSAGEQWPNWLYTQPRYGIWHCLHGNSSRHMAWVGVSAYRRGEKKTRVAICMQQHPEQNPQFLFVCEGSVDLSLSQTMDSLLWTLATIFPETLRKLQASPRTFLQVALIRFEEQNKLGTGQATSSHGLDSSLLMTVSKVFVCHVLSYLRTKLLYRGRWILLTRPVSHPLQILDDLVHSTFLMPPRGYFWADPVLLEYEGRLSIFFEEYVFAQGKGRLACMELDDAGRHTEVKAVLELPYHLSYPFLFHYQGALYLMPESAENRTLDVYRCERFPDQWVHVKTLMSDVEAYDATLHFHLERWWLFVNLRAHPGSSPHELLYLFSADTPLSDTWEPHPYNPIVSQAASARPAGALFEHDGIIYRPSQNCAGSYGRGLNLNQIMEWNGEHYTEKIVEQCIPAGQGGLNGIHTFSFAHGWVVSDGIYVRKWWQERHD